MSFVQDLLSGTFTAPASGGTHLVLSGSKTVTAGNTIVLFSAGWTFGSGHPGDTVVDNLGNTYTREFWDSEFTPTPPEIDLYVFTAPVTNPGTLTTITFSHWINWAYHVSACSCEFTEAITLSGLAEYYLGTTATGGVFHGAGTSLSTAPVTAGPALLLHFCGLGGGGGSVDFGEQGDGTGYAHPTGFTLAASEAVGAQDASSCFISFMYGELTADVLTCSWDDTVRASVMTCVGAAWTPPTNPNVYSLAATVFNNVPPGPGGGTWDGTSPAVSCDFRGPLG